MTKYFFGEREFLVFPNRNFTVWKFKHSVLLKFHCELIDIIQFVKKVYTKYLLFLHFYDWKILSHFHFRNDSNLSARVLKFSVANFGSTIIIFSVFQLILCLEKRTSINVWWTSYLVFYKLNLKNGVNHLMADFRML